MSRESDTYRKFPEYEPIDITDLTNHVTPSWCTTKQDEYEYWRRVPLIYPAAKLQSNYQLTKNAHAFVKSVLLDRKHPGRLHTLDEPRHILCEGLIYWDMIPDIRGTGDSLRIGPYVRKPDVQALFDLLHTLNGVSSYIRVKLYWKDSWDGDHQPQDDKREIAPGNTGRTRFMKRKILNLLETAMGLYTLCRNTPSSVPPMQKWGKYMSAQTVHCPYTSDARRYEMVKDWLADRTFEVMEEMWNGNARRAGFVKYEFAKAFGMVEHVLEDSEVEFYLGQGADVPNIPCHTRRLFWSSYSQQQQQQQ